MDISFIPNCKWGLAFFVSCFSILWLQFDNSINKLIFNLLFLLKLIQKTVQKTRFSQFIDTKWAVWCNKRRNLVSQKNKTELSTINCFLILTSHLNENNSHIYHEWKCHQFFYYLCRVTVFWKLIYELHEVECGYF